MYEFNHLKITQIILWIEVKLDWLAKTHKQEKKRKLARRRRFFFRRKIRFKRR